VRTMTADTFASFGGIANCRRSALFTRKSHESIYLCMGERRFWRPACGSPGTRHAHRARDQRPRPFRGKARSLKVHHPAQETPDPRRVHCLYGPHLYGIGSSRAQSECRCKGHARYTTGAIVFEGTNALRGSSARSLRHAQPDGKRNQRRVTGAGSEPTLSKAPEP
jgi:hypothetical protein